jgi:hypothetical protein
MIQPPIATMSRSAMSWLTDCHPGVNERGEITERERALLPSTTPIITRERTPRKLTRESGVIRGSQDPARSCDTHQAL